MDEQAPPIEANQVSRARMLLKGQSDRFSGFTVGAWNRQPIISTMQKYQFGVVRPRQRYRISEGFIRIGREISRTKNALDFHKVHQGRSPASLQWVSNDCAGNFLGILGYQDQQLRIIPSSSAELPQFASVSKLKHFGKRRVSQTEPHGIGLAPSSAPSQRLESLRW